MRSTKYIHILCYEKRRGTLFTFDYNSFFSSLSLSFLLPKLIYTLKTFENNNNNNNHSYTRQSDLFLFLFGRWHFTCFIFARPFFFVLPIHCFSFYTWMRNIKWKIKVKMKWFGTTNTHIHTQSEPTTFSGNLTGWTWRTCMPCMEKKCREIIMNKPKQKKEREKTAK